MEKYLISLVTALLVITIGLILTAGLVSYNRQLAQWFDAQDNLKTNLSTTLTTNGLPQVISPNSTSTSISDSSLSSETMVTDIVNDNATQLQHDPIIYNTIDDSSGLLAQDSNDLVPQESVVRKQYMAADDPGVCNTTACERAGKIIQQSLNTTVDPCVDFYEFACGGWEATHTIPADKSRYGSFDAVDEQLKIDIKEYLSDNITGNAANSVIYASKLYKACVDEDTINARGMGPLQAALQSIGGWSLAGQSSGAGNDYDWRDGWAKSVAKFGLATIFSIAVQPDANDTLVNRVYFDSSTFGLGRNQLVNTSAYPDIVNAYKKYILQSAVLLGAKNDSQTQKQVDDLVEFESQLASLSLPPEKKRDASVWYNRMSYEAFNQLTQNTVDWLNITNKIYEEMNSTTIVVKSDELVIIQDIDYFKGVTQLVAKTPGQVLANYMGWMVVMSLGSFTTRQFRDIMFQFDRVVSGVEKQPDLWQTCTNSLTNTLQYAVSRLYVDKNFSQQDKQQTALMIADIKESYNQLIQESDWLDDKTKNLSLIKLNAIKQNIGYPDWMLDNDELDKYYNLKQTVDPKKSFESILYVQYILALREFNQLRQTVNLTTSWPMPPAIVNAAYEPTQNSITIPAGILKIPFFDSQRPAYLNYGAIGLVVGHEMTHGFDDEGSQYDSKGDLINWWSDAIHKRFEDKANCFVNEYSDIFVPEVQMHLNGKNTVGENIADNGGMRESYRAFELWMARHGTPQRLPHVSQYTPQQLYFISHANVWCSLWRPEALKTQIQYNPHSPGKYRVNVPVSNFKAFSEAYGCPTNSPMNRKDKCVLW